MGCPPFLEFGNTWLEVRGEAHNFLQVGDRCHNMRYSHFEMPSWWSGRLKALRRIPKKDIVDVFVASSFLLALSALMVVPIVTNM